MASLNTSIKQVELQDIFIERVLGRQFKYLSPLLLFLVIKTVSGWCCSLSVPSFPSLAKRDGKGTRRKTYVGWSPERGKESQRGLVVVAPRQLNCTLSLVVWWRRRRSRGSRNVVEQLPIRNSNLIQRPPLPWRSATTTIQDNE